MGNGCCYNKIKIIDKDFDVSSISQIGKNDKENKLNNKIDESNLLNNTENTKNTKQQNNKIFNSKNESNKFEIREFDYNSNLNPITLSQNDLIDNNLLDIKKKITFAKILPEQFLKFSSEVLQVLNKARTDFLGFVDILENFIQNFHLFSKKIYDIKDEKIKEILSRNREDLILTKNFFKNLIKTKNKINKRLNDINEKADLMLSIPEVYTKLFDEEFLNKFKDDLKIKFPNKYKIRKIKCEIFLHDPEFSFILVIAKDPKRWEFLFQKELKYVGIDLEEFTKETYILSLVFAFDYNY